jgi:hypothetical protein
MGLSSLSNCIEIRSTDPETEVIMSDWTKLSQRLQARQAIAPLIALVGLIAAVLTPCFAVRQSTSVKERRDRFTDRLFLEHPPASRCSTLLVSLPRRRCLLLKPEIS